MTAWLLITLGTIVLKMLADELLDWCPWFARRMIKRAAARLAEKHGARYEAEWLAELDVLPGKGLSKLLFGARILRGARDTGRALDSPSAAAPSFVERATEVACAVFMIVFFAPLFVFIATLVRRSGPGPVLLRLQCRGANGEPFTVWRFRTFPMVAGELKRTAVGRWLDRTGLEGLPQLFNVVRGDMGLFGEPAIPVKVVEALEERGEPVPPYRPGMATFQASVSTCARLLRGSVERFRP
jgi:lipopolysaccharide/colanic/teichoic acid biosynthesis glycosyltransferase